MISAIESINEILSDPTRGGYDPENLRKMVDETPKKDLEPRRNNIMSQISYLSSIATSNDSLLFYFSGHGIEKNDHSYLLPNDARYNVLDETSLRIEWIKKTMNASNARVKTIIFDACHSGAIKGKSLSGVMTKGFEETIFPAPEGFVVLSSCKRDEVSWEDNELKHGVFSYYLAEGLKGNADFDRNSIISVSELNKFVFENVSSWALAHSKTQSPNLECRILGDIEICKVPSSYVYLAPKEMPITQITLRTGDVYNPEGLKSKFCGLLLNYIDPENINYDYAVNTTNFGIGMVKTITVYRSKFLEFSFDYSEENREQVDNIITMMDENALFDFLLIEFNFSMDIDLNYLVKSSKERGFKIISYEIAQKTVKIELPSELESEQVGIAFVGKNKGSSIIFQGKLGKNFYKKINPRIVMKSFITHSPN